MLANNNKDVHKRLDETIKQCVEYGLEYNNYSFSEVGIIDGTDLRKLLNPVEVKLTMGI